MVGCLYAFCANSREGITLKNGGKLKLRMFRCAKAWDCLDAFSRSMFRKETERMTPIGLMISPNLVGIDLFLAWMNENCRHPQRSRIIEHLKTLKPLGVVIPTPILKMIDVEVEKREMRRG